MHELSIAESILNHVQREMTARQISVIDKIGLRLGALSGVMPDALQFCFQAIVAGTSLEKTELVIENLQIMGKCESCSHEFPIENFFFSCPACRSVQIQVLQGYELEIAYLEIPTTEQAS